MPALSKSTLTALLGTDYGNVPVFDMLYNSSFSRDIIITLDSGRVASTVSANLITFTGGDSSPFAIGNYVSFLPTDGSAIADVNAYQITAIGPAANTFTLASNPNTGVRGDAIYVSANLDPATTYSLRATQYQSGAVTVTRGVVDLGNPTLKTGYKDDLLLANILNADVAQGATSITVLGDVTALVPNGSKIWIGNQTDQTVYTTSALTVAGGLSTFTVSPATAAAHTAGEPIASLSLITPLNLDASVSVVNAAQGWLRINLAPTTFKDEPTPADAPAGQTPTIFAGNLAINRPGGTNPVLNPPTIERQRMVWLIWSNLGE